MTIYTKKGDRGESSTPHHGRKSKSDSVFEFLGNLDELNVAIGLARTQIKNQSINSSLKAIQSELLTIGSITAIGHHDCDVTLFVEATDQMEKQIDDWDSQLPKLANFILPAGQGGGVHAHQIRALTRRAERSLYRLPEPSLPDEIKIYLNRLSDYCFQMARYLNHQNGITDDVWQR